MPTGTQLELALAGVALARNWLVGERDTIERIEGEVESLLLGRSDDWRDVPERSVAEGYPEWSTVYDHAGNPIVQLEETVVPGLLSQTAPGDALDAACGTGRHSALLAELGHRVVGVDATEAMLAVARGRVPGAEFRLGSLTDLPLEDASVDLAVCSLALTHVDDIRPALAELGRVVRVGGRLVLSDVHPVLVALGSHGAYRLDGDRAGFVRNHVHWPGAYLSAFSAAKLEVIACHDVLYRRAEVDLWADRVALAADVVAEALVGLPGVLVWDLARA